ncbi:MAG TPA: PEP-CTERM sorting domain-containing protein [Candidatus Aquabacterium excrementipullorum]|nr:PEP-CTERM sorting domain-containing protein [Candidatus Aquabacterium excrementipullorum]
MSTRLLLSSLVAAAAVLSLTPVHAANVAGLTSNGYAENFDAMGTSGTTAPLGWSVFVGDSGSHTTWLTSITANGSDSVASMVAASSGLTATSSPSGTKITGFNAAYSSTNTADRVLATSPTSVTGAALQLTLSNDTGVAVTELVLSYDTRRFSTVSTVEELPGYQLFYSLDGSSWTNVSALNPSIAEVPNSIGVTTVSDAHITLSSAVAAGASVYLRWVDDNGKPTSPDQIIGLNNVSVSAVLPAVPEPQSLALAMAGLGVLGLVRRAKRHA